MSNNIASVEITGTKPHNTIIKINGVDVTGRLTKLVFIIDANKKDDIPTLTVYESPNRLQHMIAKKYDINIKAIVKTKMDKFKKEEW